MSGAALAVALGTVGLVGAASSSDAPGLTPITACRLVDTRPDFQVGPRQTPLGAADTYTIAAEGAQGQCNIPSAATALALNVTAVDATQPTFLTLWDDGELPNASSLNPTPGQPPTPNAVTVPLTGGGTFNIYNFQGSVHVVIDVVGFHQPHDHDDRYYTKSQVNTALGTKADTSSVYTRSQIDTALDTKADTSSVYTRSQLDTALGDLEDSIDDKADAATTYTEAEVDALLEDQAVIARSQLEDDAPDLGAGTPGTLVTRDITVPGPGMLLMFGTVELVSSAGPDADCSLRLAAASLPSSARTNEVPGTCTTQSAANVAAGTHTVDLRGSAASATTIGEASLTVVFIPLGLAVSS